MTKQVIVVRKDLKCRKGKLAAQVAHASIKPFFDQGSIVDHTIYIKLPKFVEEWIKGIFTKIVVYVNSEEELIEIYDKAREICSKNPNTLWYSMIIDAGLTEFHGIPTKTAVSILGLSELVDTITGDLPLL